jgi:hypothetical protein
MNSEPSPALHHLAAASAHLSEVAKALMAPPEPPHTVADEGARVARSAELSGQKAGLWAHVREVSGGFWVTACYDPIEVMPGIYRAPDHPHQEYAAADLDEVFAVLRRRFGE